MTDLEKLIQQSREHLSAMSWEEKCEMYAAQKASYVRAEMAMGTDADEVAYRATPLDDPRVKALVEALREYACDCDYACEQLNGTCGDTARAALSALEENK